MTLTDLLEQHLDVVEVDLGSLERLELDVERLPDLATVARIRSDRKVSRRLLQYHRPRFEKERERKRERKREIKRETARRQSCFGPPQWPDQRSTDRSVAAGRGRDVQIGPVEEGKEGEHKRLSRIGGAEQPRGMAQYNPGPLMVAHLGVDLRVDRGASTLILTAGTHEGFPLAEKKRFFFFSVQGNGKSLLRTT